MDREWYDRRSGRKLHRIACFDILLWKFISDNACLGLDFLLGLAPSARPGDLHRTS